MDVLILRDPKESAKKCSLTSLRGAPGVRFLEYHPERRFAVGRRVLLTPGGEPLGEADRGQDLLLVDCAWRRVPRVLGRVDGELLPRRLPSLATAYPRRSRTFADPEQGLASIEALYATSVLLGDPHPEWLAGYRWAEEFLALNPALRPVLG
jgi:ribosome biogenesis protein Tsr3